jgi:hypothetical protein
VVRIDADTFNPDDLLEELIYEGLTHVNANTGHTIYSVEASETDPNDGPNKSVVINFRKP